MARTSKKSRAVKKSSYLLTGLVVTTFTTVGILGMQNLYTISTNNAREQRIRTIYNDINLGSDYQLIRENIFGEKRPYEHEAGRSFSSERDYTRNSDVTATAKDITKKIEAAGFKYFDEPYPGSTQVQYHFKSPKNEYVRMSVSSKPYNDKFMEKLKTKKEPGRQDFLELNKYKSKGPSEITLKVNLDDNNE